MGDKQIEIPFDPKLRNSMVKIHDCGSHVLLTPGLDPSFFVGFCSKCKKQVILKEKML